MEQMAAFGTKLLTIRSKREAEKGKARLKVIRSRVSELRTPDFPKSTFDDVSRHLLIHSRCPLAQAFLDSSLAQCVITEWYMHGFSDCNRGRRSPAAICAGGGWHVATSFRRLARATFQYFEESDE